MRRRVVRDHDGNAVTAEDVLDPEEAAEYRRQHPRPPVHQMRFYPAAPKFPNQTQPEENACPEPDSSKRRPHATTA